MSFFKLKNKDNSNIPIYKRTTQLYRYLRIRQIYQPIFLQRNLSYINFKSKQKRNQTKAKKKFKLNDLYKKACKQNDEFSTKKCTGNDLKISIKSILDVSYQEIKTDMIYTIKLVDLASHNNRKFQVHTAACDYNVPSDEQEKDSGVNSDDQACVGGSTKKSAKSKPAKSGPKYKKDTTSNTSKQTRYTAPILMSLQGAQVLYERKTRYSQITRRKSAKSTNYPDITIPGHLMLDAHMQPKLNCHLVITVEFSSPYKLDPKKVAVAVFETIVCVIEDDLTCSMLSGVYDLQMTRRARGYRTLNSSKGALSDLVINNGTNRIYGEKYLNFQAKWQTENPSCKIKRLVAFTKNSFTDDAARGPKRAAADFSISYRITCSLPDNSCFTHVTNGKCPICYLSLPSSSATLAHLKTCHPRFRFCLTPKDERHDYADPSFTHIDVSLSPSYDGSYEGSPHFADTHGLIRQPESLLPRSCLASDNQATPHHLRCHHEEHRRPNKRNPLTEIITYRQNQSMMDCLKQIVDTDETPSTNKIKSGHRRIYYSAITGQPIHVSAIQESCIQDDNCDWQQERVNRLIDEYTDVNDCEKTMMQIWNKHIHNHNYLGMKNGPIACMEFVEEHGEFIVSHNLERNMILHFCNMADFGLLTGEGIVELTALFIKKFAPAIHNPIKKSVNSLKKVFPRRPSSNDCSKNSPDPLCPSWTRIISRSNRRLFLAIKKNRLRRIAGSNTGEIGVKRAKTTRKTVNAGHHCSSKKSSSLKRSAAKKSNATFIPVKPPAGKFHATPFCLRFGFSSLDAAREAARVARAEKRMNRVPKPPPRIGQRRSTRMCVVGNPGGEEKSDSDIKVKSTTKSTKDVADPSATESGVKRGGFNAANQVKSKNKQSSKHAKYDDVKRNYDNGKIKRCSVRLENLQIPDSIKKVGKKPVSDSISKANNTLINGKSPKRNSSPTKTTKNNLGKNKKCNNIKKIRDGKASKYRILIKVKSCNLSMHKINRNKKLQSKKMAQYIKKNVSKSIVKVSKRKFKTTIPGKSSVRKTVSVSKTNNKKSKSKHIRTNKKNNCNSYVTNTKSHKIKTTNIVKSKKKQKIISKTKSNIGVKRSKLAKSGFEFSGIKVKKCDKSQSSNIKNKKPILQNVKRTKLQSPHKINKLKTRKLKRVKSKSTINMTKNKRKRINLTRKSLKIDMSGIDINDRSTWPKVHNSKSKSLDSLCKFPEKCRLCMAYYLSVPIEKYQHDIQQIANIMVAKAFRMPPFKFRSYAQCTRDALDEIGQSNDLRRDKKLQSDKEFIKNSAREDKICTSETSRNKKLMNKNEEYPENNADSKKSINIQKTDLETLQCQNSSEKDDDIDVDDSVKTSRKYQPRSECFSSYASRDKFYSEVFRHRLKSSQPSPQNCPAEEPSTTLNDFDDDAYASDFGDYVSSSRYDVNGYSAYYSDCDDVSCHEDEDEDGGGAAEESLCQRELCDWMRDRHPLTTALNNKLYLSSGLPGHSSQLFTSQSINSSNNDITNDSITREQLLEELEGYREKNPTFFDVPPKFCSCKHADEFKGDGFESLLALGSNKPSDLVSKCKCPRIE